MYRIKTIWLLLFLVYSVVIANAQSSFVVEASQQYSSFKYSDSYGTNLNSEYSGIYTGSYGIGYSFNFNNGILIRSGVGIRKAGATLVYDAMNYSWNLQYADLKLGFGYILKKEKISPYLTVSGYYGKLLRGYQTINNEDFDIKESKSISDSDYGVIITPGVRFTFSEIFSSYLEFNYLMGLQNLEKDISQESMNKSLGLTLGVAISFGK